MKVIFLDFDGVINNYNNFDNAIDYKCLSILKKIIALTGAKVVITSSNKYPYQRNIGNIPLKERRLYKEYLKPLLENGIDIYDMTPFVEENREKEILAYLEQHKEIEEYLILDDDYCMSSLCLHEIYIDLMSGLTEDHINPALNILNGKLEFYHDYIDYLEDEASRNKRMNEKILKLKLERK